MNKHPKLAAMTNRQEAHKEIKSALGETLDELEEALETLYAMDDFYWYEYDEPEEEPEPEDDGYDDTYYQENMYDLYYDDYSYYDEYNY